MEPCQLYFLLMCVSVPLMGVLGWVIAQLLGSRSSKPGRTASSWLACGSSSIYGTGQPDA